MSLLARAPPACPGGTVSVGLWGVGLGMGGVAPQQHGKEPQYRREKNRRQKSPIRGEYFSAIYCRLLPPAARAGGKDGLGVTGFSFTVFNAKGQGADGVCLFARRY